MVTCAVNCLARKDMVFILQLTWGTQGSYTSDPTLHPQISLYNIVRTEMEACGRCVFGTMDEVFLTCKEDLVNYYSSLPFTMFLAE
jgi:hypothetical protein